ICREARRGPRPPALREVPLAAIARGWPGHHGSGPMPLWLRMSLFLLAIIGLVIVTTIYVFRRGVRVLGLGRRGRLVLAGVLASAPLMIVASRVVERSGSHTAALVLGTVGLTIALGVLISTV